MKITSSTLVLLFISLSIYSQDLITISNIIITGNNITHQDIILRELIFSKNNSFPKIDLTEKIEDSKENLINLKLFNFVEIEHVILEDKAEITINLTERWYIWPYPVFEISERNFNSWWENFKAAIIENTNTVLLINESISQTLSRTLITSLTTILVLISLRT